MEKIGFIELANHNEVLRAYLIQVISLPSISEIQVFTTQWIHNQLYDFHEHSHLKWNIIEEVRDLDAYIDVLAQMDLVLLTTPEDSDAKPLILPSGPNLAAVIHKSNSYFRPLRNLEFGPSLKDYFKDAYRLLDLLISKRKARNRTINAMSLLVFPTNKGGIVSGSRKPWLVWPFAVNDELSRPIQRLDNKILITIPGIITDKSRDYDLVINAFQKVNTSDIILTLLGRPSGKYGNRIIRELDKLGFHTVRHFDKFIAQDEFDKIMRSTDFLILPMKKYMKFGVVREQNGYSCASGNINDMIRYGLPALLPTFYPLPEELNNTTAKYASADHLANLITNWIEEKKYNTIKQYYMKEAMQAFDKSKMASDFIVSFDEMKLK